MTDLTLIFALGPPLVITLFLLFFIRSKIYKRIIVTLIMVLWVNAFVLILEFSLGAQQYGSSQGVNEGVLAAQFGLAVLQSGAYALEQLLFWGFVAFFAVVIGSIYLLITCLRRKGGSLVDRMNEVSFKGTAQNPLISPFDVFGLQSYLIIGLVTMPSMISIIIGMNLALQAGTLTVFTFNVIYYVLVFYRFSLLAYTRIASKAGLHFGKEDIGKKYEKRMLSWFTILNLVISIVLLAYTLLTLGATIDLSGAIAAATIIEMKELLVAVLVLPFVEVFAVMFFPRFWRFWTRLGTRLRGIKLKPALYSLSRGIVIGGACFVLFYTILSFITAGTTFFSVFSEAQPPIFNTQVGTVEIYKFVEDLSGKSYSVLLLPALWSLVCLFLFQFIKVLIGGTLTHRRSVAPEYSVIVAGVTIAVLIWWIMPATNFILGYSAVNLSTDTGLSTLSYLYVPSPLVGEFYAVYYVVQAPSVLLYTVFLDFPIWIFGSLLLAYFFKFRRELVPPKKEVGVFRASDFFRLFISFCVVIVASVAALVAINPATPLGDFVHGLLGKLWFPNYTEQTIFTAVGSSWVFFHNMIRFLLTVFAPLLLWVSVVGIWKYWKAKKGKLEIWHVLAIALLVAEAVVLVDRFTYIAIIAIPLVLAALYRVFYRIVKRTPPKTMFRTTFLKISFYSLILSEIYSTAIAIADRYMFPLPTAAESFHQGGNLGLLSYLLILIPHGLIEIPAVMLAALVGLYIARRMTAKIDEDEKNLDKFLAEGKNLITSRAVWYPILFVTIFFVVAAAIEIYVTWRIIEPLVNAFGFA